jgi:hypothetical protein
MLHHQGPDRHGCAATGASIHRVSIVRIDLGHIALVVRSPDPCIRKSERGRRRGHPGERIQGDAQRAGNRPRSRHGQRKLDGVGEAKLVALCCSEPPGGRSRWTLALLGDALVALKVTDSISYETVRRTLKKTS